MYNLKLILLKLTFVFMLLIGARVTCLPQVPSQPVVFQSPNAATMGLFGDVPVSYFTGLAQIQVPMYNFQDNGISIPINLSYHASGFRPDMHPGWTGLGWNLSSTYAVTRSVNDDIDEYSNLDGPYGTTVAGDEKGFYWCKILVDTPIWNQLPYLNFIVEEVGGHFDMEPDEFSFSYPGGSGKFYFDTKGNCKVKCDKPVTITFDGTFLPVPFDFPYSTFPSSGGNTESFSGFVLTDEQGVRYTFGKDTTAMEYSMDFFNQYEAEWFAQAWYLTKIEKPEGHVVNLTYQRDNYINQMNTAVYCNLETRTSVFPGSPFLAVSCNSVDDTDKGVPNKGKLISPVYLTRIQGSNTRVTFIRSTSTELGYPSTTWTAHLARFNEHQSPSLPFLPYLDPAPSTDLEGLSRLKFKKLDTIKIETADGVAQRNYVLGYNNISTERLMLKSVTEIGMNNEKKPPYLLFYDNSVPLPPYLANKNDHWGFYNNNEANLNVSNYYSTYYAKREPNAAYLYAGILNKIIYPTGGVTEFIYEPHSYRYRLYEQRSLGIDLSYSTNTIAGGLRIKKIISYDINTDSVKKIKEYFYEVGAGASTGVLGGRVRYYFNDYRIPSFNDPDVTYSKRIFSTVSVLPGCNNAQGSHIGYSLVTEKLADKSYTKYYFTNFNDGGMSNANIDDGADALVQISRTAYEPYSSREAERGNLYKQESFTNTNKLLEKKEIFYTALNKSSEFARSIKSMGYAICEGGSGAVEGTAYKLYTYSYLPSQEKTTSYDQNGSNPIVRNTYFSYNQKRLLAKDSTFDSKGQNLQTYYRYPFDVLGYTIVGTVPTTRPMGYMVQNNIIGTPVEVVKTKKVSGSEIIMSSSITEFKNFNSFVKPYKELVYKNPSAPVLKSTYINYSIANGGSSETITKDNRLEQRVIYSSYDTKGNITDFGKDLDLNSGYQWSYNQTLPVVQISNAQTSPIKEYYYQGFEDVGSAATSTPFAGKKYYSGDYTVPFTIPNAKSYLVNYYSLQSGTWVKITKAFTSNMVLNEGTAIDEVRVYPSDAQLKSYTYDAVVGITSESDENGATRLYEYDGLGRLTTIRDEDKNILKQIGYSYQWWQPTNAAPQCKPCAANPAFISNITQYQYRDNNPSSPTYNQTRWVDGGTSALCVPASSWQNTATPYRCKLNEVNQNTGEREREQVDINPCSGSMGFTRWVVVDVNTTACPINMTAIMINSGTTVPSGTISFSGTSGTYTFGIPSNGSYNVGSIPGGIYDITLSVSGSYYFTFNGMNYYGSNNVFPGRPVGGSSFNMTVN